MSLHVRLMGIGVAASASHPVKCRGKTNYESGREAKDWVLCRLRAVILPEGKLLHRSLKPRFPHEPEFLLWFGERNCVFLAS